MGPEERNEKGKQVGYQQPEEFADQDSPAFGDEGSLHPIARAIDKFVHDVRDIEECAKQCMPQAQASFLKRGEELEKIFLTNHELVSGESSREEKLVAARELRRGLRLLARFENDATISTLERSLFIGLFACLDKFVGELLMAVYTACPELYKGLSAQLNIADVLAFPSLVELKESVLDKEIEGVRRKSYSEQFKEFEKRFSFETLTKFESWPAFIEAAQRRNLFTHCDGVISNQYLKSCADVGYKVDEEHVVGHRLALGSKYFFKSCFIIAEVGVMLGQTIWRKMLPEDLRLADTALNKLIYEYLQIEQWHKVTSLCKFSSKLPKISDDIMARMFTINHAIAVKNTNGVNAARKILDKKDWSASIYDFKLARSVILEEYDEAGKIMKKIGESGELIYEEAYHDWPLFKKFRESEQFLDGYEAVYGVKYLAKLAELVTDAQDNAE
ncbi:hypothetical protein [Pseudomonas syringae]|uniref:Uncharacterized protein n=1 Tax=Pseudomonas syringae UB303 TaxID=1357287 RepID=A0AAJ4E4N0_PSESX|nr:hypothetical protein [Pseudomonas syringae]QHF08655.1 hypothetical protein N026_14730 [Pseudomonas syringae UB303]